MSKKLTGNGLWESSRMMLPEHKERIIKHNQYTKKKVRKELDEQEWETISRALNKSITNEEAITVTLYGEYQDSIYRGVVDRTDQEKMRIGGQWIHFADIVGVKW